MNQINKLDRNLPIFALLSDIPLPKDGELHLCVNTWKRSSWMHKKYVFKYHEPDNVLEYHLAIYEQICTYCDDYDEFIDTMYECYKIYIDQSDELVDNVYETLCDYPDDDYDDYVMSNMFTQVITKVPKLSHNNLHLCLLHSLNMSQ